MSEEMIIRHCAPTLASMKTGSMFSCAYETPDEVFRSIRDLNRRLRKKGLRVLPLRWHRGRCLVYVYRPDKLHQDLQDGRVCRILRACGYACEKPERCVARLMKRLMESEEFPHEIGLFLGYPPEDVEGFMHRKGEAKCTGYWKVYGDVEAAQKIFARYQKCTDVYLKQHAMGRDIERLTVAV